MTRPWLLLIPMLILAALSVGAAVGTVGVPRFSLAYPAPVPTQPPIPPVSWPTFDGDPSRSGVNQYEHILDPSNVGHLAVVWSQHLPGPADSSPIYRGGRLFVTLMNGTTVAVDIGSGRILWRADTVGPRFTTASPTLDPLGNWVYAYGLDGYVHRYATVTGQEGKSGGWPIQVTSMPNDEKGSSALNLANGRLYVTISGYPSDGGHFQGHLVTIDLASGKATIFNTLCSNLLLVLGAMASGPGYCSAVHAGVWARAGAVVDPVTNRVFIATGDGPWDGSANWGDSVLALTPDGHSLVDSYTPKNQDGLNHNDGDFGSSAPALLPPSSLSAPLAVQGSKDGTLRLLNRRDLSGRGRLGQLGGELQIIDAPKGCEVRTTPVVWTDPGGATWVFVATDCALAGYTVAADGSGHIRLQQKWIDSPGGSSPLLANGVLYEARGRAIEARDPLTGKVLWRSDALGAKGTLAPTHWQSPIVVDGRIYFADGNGTMIAFGLPNSRPEIR